jgi:hypothetical protein
MSSSVNPPPSYSQAVNLTVSIPPGVGNVSSEHARALMTMRADYAELEQRVRRLADRVDKLDQRSQGLSLDVISTLGRQGVRLRSPVGVLVYETPDEVQIVASDLEVFAVAATYAAAMEQFKGALVDDYSYLTEHEADLGPALIRRLSSLRELIVEESA